MLHQNGVPFNLKMTLILILTGLSICYFQINLTRMGYNPPMSWPQGDVGRPRGDERAMVELAVSTNYGHYPPPGIWGVSCFWPDMKISADGNYWGNCLRPARPARVASDRWQCVEVMLKLNSAPEKADGELALWLDGRLQMHVKPGVRRGPWSGMGFNVVESGGEPFEGFRWRTSSDLKVNFLWLLYNITEAGARLNKVKESRINRVWFDDIVVSTAYVGPIHK